MKWLVFLTSLFIYQLNAQSIQLKIVDSSIRVRNDTLYFKYKFQNESDSSIVFYNTRCTSIDFFGIDSLTSAHLKVVPMPCVLIQIFNHKNELPQLYFEPIRHDKLITDLYNDKYAILEPKRYKEYEGKQVFWPNQFTDKEYKLQLVYFSNSYYKYDFIKLKKKDKELRHCKMFVGILKSNIVLFTSR